MRTPEEVQIALLAYLKSLTTITDLLGAANQIKETQWQGQEFCYPAIRLGNDVMPSQDGCSPDSVEGAVSIFTEDKTSKKCSHLSGIVAQELHRKNFTSTTNGVKFTRIIVTKITYPTQMEGMNIWQSQVQFTALVS